MDSEGLLLFTNDGEFANLLAHPSHQVDKVYHVVVRDFSEAGLRQLRQPVTLDGYQIKPPDVTVLSAEDKPKVRLQVTIHEGRNRQVRRMCAMAGMKVVRLVRVQEGPLSLGSLPLGQWRYLTEAEVGALRK
jgi:23S rRNA pseudouridine2605 synthase